MHRYKIFGKILRQAIVLSNINDFARLVFLFECGSCTAISCILIVEIFTIKNLLELEI